MSHTLKYGFSLVEIMIVVAIIGVLTAIAIPNYLKAGRLSQKNSCIANLKLIESAVEAAKFTIPANEISMEKMVGPDNFIKSTPLCPTENKAYIDLDPPVCPTLPDEHNLNNL